MNADVGADLRVCPRRISHRAAERAEQRTRPAMPTDGHECRRGVSAPRSYDQPRRHGGHGASHAEAAERPWEVGSGWPRNRQSQVGNPKSLSPSRKAAKKTDHGDAAQRLPRLRLVAWRLQLSSGSQLPNAIPLPQLLNPASRNLEPVTPSAPRIARITRIGSHAENCRRGVSAPRSYDQPRRHGASHGEAAERPWEVGSGWPRNRKSLTQSRKAAKKTDHRDTESTEAIHGVLGSVSGRETLTSFLAACGGQVTARLSSSPPPIQSSIHPQIPQIGADDCTDATDGRARLPPSRISLSSPSAPRLRGEKPSSATEPHTITQTSQVAISSEREESFFFPLAACSLALAAFLRLAASQRHPLAPTSEPRKPKPGTGNPAPAFPLATLRLCVSPLLG